MEKRMNILVLGGTGFFGKHLVWELLHRGHGGDDRNTRPDAG